MKNTMHRPVVRVVSLTLAINILFQAVFPGVALGLTGGPSQPEVATFTPIATSDMVSPFTGDFNYNIPLLDVEGYPINIAYNSGISMDQEASWVGLGWNINPGVMNRSMRGLPDDFRGEKVEKEFNIKDNTTFGVYVGAGAEIGGKDNVFSGGVSVSMGVLHNNYTGYNVERSISTNISVGGPGSSKLTGGLGLKSSSEEGLTISPNVSFSVRLAKLDDMDSRGSLFIGTAFNSRSGLKALTFSGSIDVAQNVQQGEDKDRLGFGSMSATYAHTFGVQTFVPQVSMPMKNYSATFSGKFGGVGTLVEATGNVSGYFSTQTLASQKESTAAYGYLYAQEGAEMDKVLLDFNREKDGAFSENSVNLPVTNFTYDVYSANGHGVSGSFRPYRGDIGTVFDSQNTNTSADGNFGVEGSVGYVAKAGADFMVTAVNTTSGKWTAGNPAESLMKFRKSSRSFESVYFKQAGEMAVDSDPAFFNTAGGFDPVRVQLVDAGLEVFTMPNYISGLNTVSPITSNQRAARQARNQHFSYLTYGEYAHGVSSDYTNPNVYGSIPSHHLAELCVTQTDGSRYVYGLPAYNTTQKEVSFNVSGRTVNSNGTVSYVGGTDNSKSNERGRDRYFNSVKTPPYAHSYLLTAVLSADYVDRTGDGPTEDDFGTYTKFIYDKKSTYKWRTPTPELPGEANYNEGVKVLDYDDQGNYVYGEKEIFYLKEIQTKNYIAVFEVAERRDAHGVTDENGGINISQALFFLKKIKLYTKEEYNNSSPIPLKTVHFVYDYSLCADITNNDLSMPPLNDEHELDNQEGKLTLKRIYFTYGNSHKAKLSPYEFSYANNYDYDPTAYDRWGNYKPDPTGTAPPNKEFPYVDQNSINIHDWASAWHLNEIKLPSGGKIKIAFEADDYAHVQDKRAMHMFTVVSSGNDQNDFNPQNPSVTNDLLYHGTTLVNNYLFIKLQTPLQSTSSLTTDNITFGNKYLRDEQLKQIRDLYFRFYTRITDTGNHNGGFEYISGYAEVEEGQFGLCPQQDANGHYTHAWIKLKKEPIDKNSPTDWVHPVSKTGWQFSRINTPELAYGFQPAPQAGSAEDLIIALASSNLIYTIMNDLKGPNKLLQSKNYSQEFVPEKSWVKLYNPDMKKYGGGSRVREIEVSDEWSSQQSGNTSSSSYTQEYSYTTQNMFGQSISSGAATYEPMVGGDENPLRKPIYHNQKREVLYAPDEEFFTEEPYGESFFPAPSVGYSKVTVKSKSVANVKRHATGKVVHEFYTCKDFPVFTKRTVLDARPKKTDPIGNLLKLNVKHYMTASQGFVVELNDMHGKPKAQWVYQEDNDHAISGIEYKYKRSGNRLDNDASVVTKKGTVSTKQIGVDFDIINDVREHETVTESAGTQVNVYFWMAAVIPIIVPPVIPSYSKQTTRFRSITTTKVINRFGLLSETVAHDLGSRISTANLAYDGETGEVLLTRTQNSFSDQLFSFNYPAHWAYNGMGHAYKNQGYSWTLTTNPSGIVTTGGSDLVAGDEILCNGTRYWLKASGPNLKVINSAGQGVIINNQVIKVLRSGRRNMPAVSVGSMTTTVNPLDPTGSGSYGSHFHVVDESFGMLGASAIEYSEQWRTFCECGLTPGQTVNPYLAGTLGNWRPKKSYTYLTERSKTSSGGNSNIRKDGIFAMYHPFWVPNSGNDWQSPGSAGTNWTWASEVTEYSPHGVELENVDPLGRYSAALYGYNYSLPILVSKNSKYNQVAFDSMEDYGYRTCTDDHLGFKQFESSNLSSSHAHSGRHSLNVGPANSISVSKVLIQCD